MDILALISKGSAVIAMSRRENGEEWEVALSMVLGAAGIGLIVRSICTLDSLHESLKNDSLHRTAV